tara:strand:+ start:751 stop:1047 length:297 start_codon:yes stop_codon:yes gene_type:complete
MRKITREACHAFEHLGEYKKDNTEVRKINDVSSEMYLHGNLIAYSDATGIYISNGGVPMTNTTKERLNGLTGVNIYQTNFQVFLNNEAWDGDWIRIAD